MDNEFEMHSGIARTHTARRRSGLRNGITQSYSTATTLQQTGSVVQGDFLQPAFTQVAMAPTSSELRKRVAKDSGDDFLTGDGILPHFPLQNGRMDPQYKTPGSKVIGLHGNWYDITDFVAKHPGGPVIELFEGTDATQVFKAYGHTESLLKHRKVIGTYSIPNRHPADADFDKLIVWCHENGFYTTNWMFYCTKVVLTLTLWFSAIACVTLFEHTAVHMFGAVLLAFVFQQGGFVMHECMHGQVFRKMGKDRTAGVLIGTVLFGMSAHWWHDEHRIHHALTNVVDVGQKFCDPQMWEACFAQNKLMFPLFAGRNLLRKLQYWAIQIQHYTFIPVVVLCGRIEILYDSTITERRPYELAAMALHWTWMIWLLSFLPTWTEIIAFWFLAAAVEGMFHFQLILSHYAKEFHTTDNFHASSWYVSQIQSNMNIDVPLWQDWYYGGLNYHIEHHLFPKMCRNKLREVGGYVKRICDKHGIEYDIFDFTEVMRRTLVHLKNTATHYKLDPR